MTILVLKLIIFILLYIFFFKNCDLKYSIDEYENEIIQNGNDIMIKYLEDRKYNHDKITTYNNNINNDQVNFILKKKNKDEKIRCCCINEIYENPIKGKYYFKYLIYGKEIYNKFIQTYSNDSLTCVHYLYLFK